MKERGSKMEKNYILGLDIGISSVGWGLLELDANNNPYKIIDVLLVKQKKQVTVEQKKEEKKEEPEEYQEEENLDQTE